VRRVLPIAAALVAAACQCGPSPQPQPGNQGPKVSILSPKDGATLGGAGPFLLKAEAKDPEEGLLVGDAVGWTSSKDGALGKGESITVALSEGAHELTCDAADRQGKHGTAKVKVTVSTVNQPPVPVIDSPANRAQFDEGKAIAFAGHAKDPEDGDLPGSALQWTSSKNGFIGSGASVSLNGAKLGDHTIVLTATDKQGLAAQTSITVTVVPVGGNHPPVATITAPASGSSAKQGQAVTFQGGASDVEDGALSGAALAWTSSKDGNLGTGVSVTTTTLSRGLHTITLTATDSGGAKGTAQILLSVVSPTNQPPVATLTAPANGATFQSGATVTFSGSATDPEDGVLSGTALAWSSSLDGALGTGGTISSSTLSAGTHLVILAATDSAGDVGAASVSITVLPPNHPPVVTITAPAGGSSVSQGTMVGFRGTAQDPEDGALTGQALTWTSSLDGQLGHAESLDTASLQVGTHQVTLSAIDSGGATGSASITLTVTKTSGNINPIARLSGPSQVEALVAADFDGSASSDADGTVVAYKLDFGDGTAPVSGSQSVVSHAFAAVGNYTVTLEVTDNSGGKGSTTLPITVTPPVRRPEIVAAPPTDSLGSVCAVAWASGPKPVIAYYAQTHPSIWLASWNGSAWSSELVDGMGFNVGGKADANLALALDASGNPHLAYVLEGTDIWWASRSGGVWTRQKVDTFTGGPVGIALDPSQGGRPTIAYTAPASTGSGYQVKVAYRSGGSFVSALTTFPTQGSSTYPYYGRYFAGGIAFDGAGKASLSYGDDYYNDISVGTWTAAGAQTAQSVSPRASGSANPWFPLVLDGSGRGLILSHRGLFDDTGAGWSDSAYEGFSAGIYALARDAAGLPWVANVHGGDLETAHPDATGFWVRSNAGPMDSAQIGITVDGAGTEKACFFRSSKLMLW
jgi:hypothetical protein